MRSEVSEAEVASLSQSILTRYGLDFTCYEPKSLRRRIIRVLNNFELESIHDLWVRMLRDPNFIQIFMNEISVGMTSMFRDPVMWRSLRSRLRSDLALKKTFSIWHSGCSTGEEVFSMGILLKDIASTAKLNAKATDINLSAIDEAKGGIYHKIKMIENESNYREYNPAGDFARHYTADGKHAVMNKELINHVDFSYHNLITDTFPTGFDLIFCRNVMIYFDNAAKLKLISKFYDSLNPGGYFIIGFFDTMTHLIDNCQFELIDDAAKIFRKR